MVTATDTADQEDPATVPHLAPATVVTATLREITLDTVPDQATSALVATTTVVATPTFTEESRDSMVSRDSTVSRDSMESHTSRRASSL